MAKKTLEAEKPIVELEDAPEIKGEDKKEKKEKAKKEKKEKKQKKKGGFPVVPVLILLLLIGGIAAVLVLNLFNLREQYIMPYLRNMPLVGQYFPQPTADPTGTDTTNRYASMTPEEILAEVTGLESQIDRLNTEAQAAKDQKATDDQTISYLQGFESQIENYRAVKAEFDQMVVTGANPEDYIAYFEQISPENAERLAQMAQQQVTYNTETKKLSSTYAEMNAQSAADALVLMLSGRQDMLVSILKNMDTDAQAKIFDNIPSDQLSQITQLLYPEQPADIPAATAPPLQE